MNTNMSIGLSVKRSPARIAGIAKTLGIEGTPYRPPGRTMGRPMKVYTDEEAARIRAYIEKPRTGYPPEFHYHLSQQRLKAHKLDPAGSTLSNTDLRAIFDAQEGKCHYCGCPLTWDGGPHTLRAVPKDPAKGFTKDNLVLVTRAICGTTNIFKDPTAGNLWAAAAQKCLPEAE